MKTPFLFAIATGLLVAGCAAPRQANLPLAPRAADSPAAGVLIVSATYGSGTNVADVTDRVDDLLHQPGVEFFARPEWLHADPMPGWNKALVIVYEFKQRRHTFTTGEGGKVSVDLLIRQTDK
jgi:hypothetical protein